MDNLIKRQNSPQAIEYHKACRYLYDKENRIKYILIFFAVFLCLSGIFVNYLPHFAEIFGYVPDQEAKESITEFANNFGKILSFVSGLWLLFQLYFSYRAHLMHKDAVSIEERFDCYVYKMETNSVLLRPISNVLIANYASRVNKKEEIYHDRYFAVDQEIDRNSVFYNQKKIFSYDYHLMIYIRSHFFNILWVGYFIFIFIIVIITDRNFLDAMTTIVFPSLSAASLIITSVTNYNEQFRFLQNVLNNIELIEKNPESKLSSPLVIRSIQDALYTHRMRSFLIPPFMAKCYDMHLRRLEKRRAKYSNKVNVKVVDTVKKTDTVTTKVSDQTTKSKVITPNSTKTTPANGKKGKNSSSKETPPPNQ